MTRFDQYFNNDVWLWNVSPPLLTSGDPDTFLQQYPIDPTIGPFSRTGKVKDGWQQRPFHPKEVGHTAIKDAIIAQMKADNIPESTPKCTTPINGVSPTVAEAQTMNGILDGMGDGTQCCSFDAPTGGCANIASVDSVAVDLCAGSKLCMGCARAANYLEGIIAACTQNGLVGGTQDINEVPGMNMQI